jgi:hypothetical protein
MVQLLPRPTQRRRARRAGAASLALLGLTALATAMTPATAAHAAAPVAAAPAAVPAPPSGFTLTWSDDFNGGSGTGVPASTWKYDTGPGSNFGTGEIETMTSSPSNVYEDGNGHLVLKALHSGTDPKAGWTSGRIETQAATFGAPAGGVVRMESVIQQPNVTTANGAGYWPAFWMLGSTLRTGTTWPTSGEVDILEDINGRSSVFGTLHCGVNPGGPCGESTGIGSGEKACAGCQTGFHDYAVEIDRSTSPEQIRWYLDGAKYFTINATQVDAATWSAAVDHPFFIIYDLAMGGGFPDAFGGGPNAATVSGQAMTIDSVAVYNKGPGSTTPTTPPATTPPATTPPATTPPTSTNIAAGKPATASSLENAGYPAAQAVDPSATTRWSSAFSDPQWLQVDLGQTYNINHVKLNWEAAYGKAYQLQTSNDGNNWTSIYSTTTGDGGTDDLAVTGTGRYLRMLGTTRGTPYGYSLYDLAVNGTAVTSTGAETGTGTLLSQGKTTTASSTEAPDAFQAKLATDGNTASRWSSTFADPQWLQVDLGATHSISKLVLNWEAAYSSAYRVETSTDGNTWTKIYSTTAGAGGKETLAVTGSGRYVRLTSTKRGTPYGNSLFEFQVYGK